MIVPGERDGTLYAGGDPGVLFESRDGGATWELNRALWEHPTRSSWEPGGGGLCLHSIVPWPGDPERLSLAVSAAGVWHTEDGGKTWHRGNQGIVPRYTPEEARPETTNFCVHRLHRAATRPERMFMQFHGGVYRSDDAGETWTDIAPGLPSDFGFPMVLDPADPDSAYVIPLSSDEDRVTPGGRVRVYETRDAGGRLGRARGGPAAGGRVPDGAQAGVRSGGRRLGARAVLRRDIGRSLRLGRRWSELVHRRDASAARLLGHSRGLSQLHQVGERPPVAGGCLGP